MKNQTDQDHEVRQKLHWKKDDDILLVKTLWFSFTIDEESLQEMFFFRHVRNGKCLRKSPSNMLNQPRDLASYPATATGTVQVSGADPTWIYGAFNGCIHYSFTCPSARPAHIPGYMYILSLDPVWSGDPFTQPQMMAVDSGTDLGQEGIYVDTVPVMLLIHTINHWMLWDEDACMHLAKFIFFITYGQSILSIFIYNQYLMKCCPLPDSQIMTTSELRMQLVSSSCSTNNEKINCHQ